MTPVEGDGALLGNYVDDGRILVVGHVTPPETKAKPSNGKAKAPSAKPSTKPAARNAKPDTTSTPHEAEVEDGPKGRMTKATAADALDAIAEAIQAQGEALKEGDGALLGNYVDDGRILVVGHVTPPETKAKPSNGKAKASQPKAAKPSVSRSQDTTSRNVGTPKASTSSDTPHEATESNGPSGRMTKATAADALDAIAEAIQAQGEALKMVAAALR
jgi:hypothetical protein